MCDIVDYQRNKNIVCAVDEIINNSNEIFTYHEKVIKEVVKKDDEYTKQAIRDYFTRRYPKENLRFDFLDEDIVNKIINLGIKEYQRRGGE